MNPITIGRAAVALGNLALAASAGLLLGGCMTVGPDYKPPAFQTPTNWTASVASPGTPEPTNAPALSRWWSVLGDPVLTELVERASLNNPDMRQAEARLRQARAQRGLAAAERMPELTAGLTASRSGSSGEGVGGGTRSSYSSSLDASWELDLFGGKRRGVESAEASLQASQEDLRDVQVSLLAEVALTYVQVRSAQVRLAILETNLALQVETYGITRWRQQANLVTQLDVDQARVSLEQTRAAIPVLRTTLDQAGHQLALLLGEAPGSLKNVLGAGPPSVPGAAPELAVGIPADVLRQRPDVRGAERRLAARTAQIGVAEAARYPDLTLGGVLGFEARVPGDLYTAGARTVQGLVRAGATLFDGGRIRQNVAIQTALQEEALAAYEASVLTALKDVEDALVAHANEQARQKALRDAATAAASAFQSARDQYESGLIDFQALLDSQQTLLIVQDSLASSQADLTGNLIRIYKALGGGWTPEPTEIPHHES